MYNKKLKINVNTIIFRKMVLTVFIYISFYSLLYFYFDAKLSAIMLLVGCVFFTPLILTQEKRYPNASRVAFCISCLFYIYATPFGIRFPMNIDFYYLAALLVPVIVFDPSKKKHIFSCVLLCPFTWTIQKIITMPEFSSYWLPSNIPFEIFQVVNFYGATVIIIVFLKYLIDQFRQQNIEMNKALNELNQFFYVALDVLCIADMKGKYIKVNPALTKLLGYSTKELTSKPFINFIHPDDVDNTIKVLEEVNQGLPIINFSNRYIAADGSYKVISWATSLDRDLGVIYAAGRDITELTEAEERLRKERSKALLNAKLASLGEMYSGLAHEINNPLMVISGNAHRLKKDKVISESGVKFIDSINKACDRIAHIVKGLKKFSHASEDVEYKRYDLKAIFTTLISMMDWKLKKYDIELTIDSGDNMFIYCNEVEIEQVIINLLSNSIDAIKDLDNRWIRIKIYKKNNDVFLQVTDSGEGISEDIELKLFEPFFTTKEIGEGTGLGLSITKGILDEHGATIELIKNTKNTSFLIQFKARG